MKIILWAFFCFSFSYSLCNTVLISIRVHSANEFTQKASKKLQNASTATLKDAAVQLNNSFVPAAANAFNIVLNLLEERLTDAEFVAFCESLE